MCRCPWTLGSASCLPMMGAQINGHLSCSVTYVPLLSAKPRLETPSMIGPRGCRTCFFRSVTWKTMLANAKPEDWWDDPSDNFGEDALECVDINRSRAALGFTVEQNTCPECSKFSKRRPKAIAIHRLRTHGHRKPLCCRNANECLVYPKCDKHFSFKSKLLDHAQYRSKNFRDKILSSQPIEA